MSPASKAQQRAVKKYMQENYDELKVRTPKGKKDEIKAHADSQGESVNSFINRAIDETIARDNAEATSAPAEQKEEHIILPWEEPSAEQKDKRPKTIEDLIQLQKQFAIKKEQEPEEEHIPLPWEE